MHGVFDLISCVTLLAAQGQYTRNKHQCLTSSLTLFTLKCEPGQYLDIHNAIRGYSNDTDPGDMNCPYQSKECTLSAVNVLKQCQYQHSCTMDANAAIKATLWDPQCNSHEVSTNFIEVNYTCEQGIPLLTCGCC